MIETGARRILIIDDATLVRMYYREAIEPHGFIVDEAFNGLEALEKLLIMPADLLIVDVNMPKMDGLSFLRTLRRHATSISAIPALVTSTEGAPHDFAAAREAGANFYLVKPIAQKILLGYVLMLCGIPA
ncbi:response regulator transcription factor [Acidocella sp.]|jgi:two-component system chemotaxis response regulator CheY|uniref:response regulator transcription factor n=1 Tax=Acidocella sp. TaxID=50710 RepID=UPI002F41D7AA